MPHINLLPWREELRKRRQKEFLGTVAAEPADEEPHGWPGARWRGVFV